MIAPCYRFVCDCSVRVRQPVGQRISVCVRKRPLTLKECKRGVEDVVTAPSEHCVNVSERKESVDLRHYILQVHYTSASMDGNPLLPGIKQPCSFQVFCSFPSLSCLCSTSFTLTKFLESTAPMRRCTKGRRILSCSTCSTGKTG